MRSPSRSPPGLNFTPGDRPAMTPGDIGVLQSGHERMVGVTRQVWRTVKDRQAEEFGATYGVVVVVITATTAR